MFNYNMTRTTQKQPDRRPWLVYEQGLFIILFPGRLQKSINLSLPWALAYTLLSPLLNTSAASLWEKEYLDASWILDKIFRTGLNRCYIQLKKKKRQSLSVSPFIG